MNVFTLVYLCIAAATAHHTAWGAAFTMQGQPPDDLLGQLAWWLSGALFAVAVDVSMLAISRAIRAGRERTPWLLLAFALVALASMFTQLLYAAHHAAPLALSAGVAPAWAAALQPLVDARVVVIPLLLPALALLYTFAGVGHRAPAPPPAESAPPPSVRPPSVRPPSRPALPAAPAHTPEGWQLRCAACGWQTVKPTLASARAALAAHMRTHVDVKETPR
jgi:hypothetical protein